MVRFVSDNPGMWFLHCHIDLHNTNGMGMVIDEGDTKPSIPAGFPTCRNFLNDRTYKNNPSINGKYIIEQPANKTWNID